MTVLDRIAAAAEGLIGTKFAHQGRRAGVGLDCLGVVVLSLRRAGVIPEDQTKYRRVPSSSVLIDELDRQLARHSAQSLVFAPHGSILLFEIGSRRQPRHLAIKHREKMIHVEQSGSSGVVSIFPRAIWNDRFVRAYVPRPTPDSAEGGG